MIEIKNLVLEQGFNENITFIRKNVFVIEQNCPPELEWEYEEESIHFLVIDNKKESNSKTSKD